ncbi:hypothetical protein L6452_43764 [Arctium lappa]|uniref:Uncharacterized protein n=1 Tax=Arctium lappa TaxID=4217 RepID=A0ACB8XDS8_ARCLA|nr:hypothetical protein L6452_43764 [Arctium lappa]
MIMEQKPTESVDELVLVKVAAWAWYRHGLGFEQKTTDHMESSDYDVAGPSRYKMEAMKNPQDMPTYFRRSMSECYHNYIGSSLLDVYEIERISKDLDYYIESGCDQYYCRKFADGVCDPDGRKNVLPLPESDTSGAKAKRRRKRKKWLRLIYEVCGSTNKGDVVEPDETHNSTARDAY